MTTTDNQLRKLNQYRRTAAMHQRLAEVLQNYGKFTDAASARRAAQLCDASAGLIERQLEQAEMDVYDTITAERTREN